MDQTGELWRLRRLVVHHPGRPATARPAESENPRRQRELLRWASWRLAAAIVLPEPCRQNDSEQSAAAGPLADAVDRILAQGSEAARLGAFALGLACCQTHQVWALDRLEAVIAADPLDQAESESTTAAQLILQAQLQLYDAALPAMRSRSMALHPSAGRPSQTWLLPAG